MAKLNKVIKQAQQMQSKMLKMQEDLANVIVDGTSGGGMVVVKMNGKHDIVDIKLDKDVVDPNDIEMLEDLIIAAINDARDKVSDLLEKEMGKLTGGLEIPGLTDLF